jgi:hypothetical protein
VQCANESADRGKNCVRLEIRKLRDFRHDKSHVSAHSGPAYADIR